MGEKKRRIVMVILKIVVSLLILLFPMVIPNSDNGIEPYDFCIGIKCEQK